MAELIDIIYIELGLWLRLECSLDSLSIVSTDHQIDPVNMSFIPHSIICTVQYKLNCVYTR